MFSLKRSNLSSCPHELDITMAYIKFNSTCLSEEISLSSMWLKNVDLLQKLQEFHSWKTNENNLITIVIKKSITYVYVFFSLQSSWSGVGHTLFFTTQL